MSYLGRQLALPTGARLTDITLLPSLLESENLPSFVFLHTITTGPEGDAASSAGCLSAHLPSAVGTISGNETDGSAWFAVLQVAPMRGPGPYGRGLGVQRSPSPFRDVANASVKRALSTTGIQGEVKARSYRHTDLRVPFTAVGADVDNWRVAELVLALLCELATNVPLREIAVDGLTIDLDADAHRARFARLEARLRTWSATHEGPEA